jgi:hypothetical protein
MKNKKQPSTVLEDLHKAVIAIEQFLAGKKHTPENISFITYLAKGIRNRPEFVGSKGKNDWMWKEPQSTQITITSNGEIFTKKLEGDEPAVWSTAFCRLREMYKDAQAEPDLQKWADQAAKVIWQKRNES